MSTIRTLITGVTVVAAGAAGAAALAATGTASAGAAAASARSFTVTAHQGSDSSVDLGDAGPSAGDEALFDAPVFRGGKHVGRLVGKCTTARVGAQSLDQLCEFVLRLPHGQITASGTVRAGQSGPGSFALPILGGTGHYQGVGGQITVTAGSGRNIPIGVSLR
jgi:hypothetical protein